MMQKATVSTSFIAVIILSLGIFLNISGPALAADTFNLFYTLTEGGNRLELSQDNPSKGVRLNINSDVATRYEVVQRIIQPIESREVPGLAIRDNFVFRGLTGTNRYGDLRVSTGDAPLRYEDVLYVSDGTGNADSFTLVYSLRNIANIGAGDYFGRISYTLSPVGSTRQPVTQILEVHISIVAGEGGVKSKIEITTPSGSKQIFLNPKRQESKSAAVIIKINGQSKKPFTIRQFLPQQPESLEGARLDYKAVSFVVKEAEKGVSSNQLTPLSSLPQNLYSSAGDGEADSTLVVNYGLGDLSGQKAGKYRSRIQYLLEEAGGVESKIDSLELDVENESVFDLVVTPQDQTYAIEFRDLKPLGPPKRNEITVEIKTNTGKRYHVDQEIRSELRNKEGKIIPNKYFTYQTQDMSTKGKLNFIEKKEVAGGNSILFISDEKGSPDKFKIIYELGCSQEVQAGDYSTSVTYSLLEM